MEIAKPGAGIISNKAAQKCLKGTVDDLTLAISLRVVGRAKTEFRASSLKELLPKGTQEDRVSVRDDGMRKTMKAEYLVHKAMGKLNSGKMSR